MTSVIDAERYSLREAAEKLNVHPTTCWRWALVGVRGPPATHDHDRRPSLCHESRSRGFPNWARPGDT